MNGSILAILSFIMLLGNIALLYTPALPFSSPRPLNLNPQSQPYDVTGSRPVVG